MIWCNPRALHPPFLYRFWAYLAEGNQSSAKAAAERALHMSKDMGYHWGKVDAEEVLEELEEKQ